MNLCETGREGGRQLAVCGSNLQSDVETKVEKEVKNFDGSLLYCEDCLVLLSLFVATSAVEVLLLHTCTHTHRPNP